MRLIVADWGMKGMPCASDENVLTLRGQTPAQKYEQSLNIRTFPPVF